MNRLLALLGLALALSLPPSAALAAGSDVAHSLPAVSGYDLVSFHTGAKPLRGNGNHVARVDGVTYLFANDANKERFEREPQKYLPAYGGYCAYGVSVGKKFVGDPDVWRIVDGRLYLNLDTKIQQLWAEDVPGAIRKADAAWTRIQDADPASL